jgi:membrane-associated phospholipid phosphatase
MKKEPESMKKTLTTCSLVLCTAWTALPAHAQVAATRDRIGDVLQYLLPAGAAALTLYEDDREGLKELAYSFALSQGTTEVLKHAVRARRPDGTGLGFPSGHASASFASAAFVHERYGIQKAIPFYGLATVVAYQRVHTHHHFTRDVVAGAGIGIGSSLLLTHPRDRGDGVSVGYGPEGAWLQYTSRW